MHDDTKVKSDEAMARLAADDCTDAEAEAIVADMAAREADRDRCPICYGTPS